MAEQRRIAELNSEGKLKPDQVPDDVVQPSLPAGPMEPRRLPDGTEPGPFVAWTADDGYTTQTDYFDLLTANGIGGTLFLTKSYVDRPGTQPSWGDDTYITTAEVEAIVAQGHELGTHGINHESYVSYLNTNGEETFAAFCDEMVDYIQDTFGVVVESGAYPAGQSNARVREITSRRHRWYRGTKGQIVRYANDPFDVRSIDIQALSEAAIKAHVDTAVATRSPAVFLVHGGLTSGDLAKYQAVIDYIDGLGVPQGTFSECMRQRVLWASPGFSITADGHVATRTVAATRVEVRRDDTLADWFAIDHDETDNELVISASQPSLRVRSEQPVDFFGQVKISSGYGDLRIPTIQPAEAAANENVSLLRVLRSAAEPNYPGEPIMVLAQNGTINLRGTHAGNFNFFAPDGSLFTRHTNGGRTWQAAGAGGAMIIDSGSGGSSIDHKGFRHRFWDHTGNRRIALCTAEPSDASLASGEVGLWFDSTNGNAALKIKGKTADGTVVQGSIALS